MRIFIAALLIASSLFAGFFESDTKQAEEMQQQEDQRLCKLFTDKVKIYQENMRSDELAAATLDSYKKRAEIYCAKVKHS
ncbi:hypothetical protein PGH07_06670 [Sulfurovum sp. zt1-1]|uniref:Uncharacterized protein n=1 Tax=Sulfurovum zhangzhouensis TaxID=3019067 RepID=A0ABT7QYE8_9BACT|nr:hypothetical protein [Sulfurovum zhangzhouensis]MDM5271855.1 hypothetical protein [Sulfurovum zhangzhouensis]